MFHTDDYQSSSLDSVQSAAELAAVPSIAYDQRPMSATSMSGEEAASPDQSLNKANQQQLKHTVDKILKQAARERIAYTAPQLELLGAIYNVCPYPNRPQKMVIAKRIQVDVAKVKVWFQNRRRRQLLCGRDRPKAANREAPGAAGSVVADAVKQQIVDEVLTAKSDGGRKAKTVESGRDAVQPQPGGASPPDARADRNANASAWTVGSVAPSATEAAARGVPTAGCNMQSFLLQLQHFDRNVSQGPPNMCVPPTASPMAYGGSAFSAYYPKYAELASYLSASPAALPTAQTRHVAPASLPLPFHWVAPAF